VLSYGHARWAEPESNRRPPPYQRGALTTELSAVVRASGRGWDRTSSLLCVRQALSRLSYSPVQCRSGARDRTSISTFRAWRPASLDDPGVSGCNRLSVHPPTGDRRSRRAPEAGDGRVVMSRPAGRRTMLSMPLAYPSTLDHRPPIAQIRNGRRPTWRSFGARARQLRKEKCRLKQTLIASVHFQQTTPRSFSLRRGLDSI
jgi:hypothetical protein